MPHWDELRKPYPVSAQNVYTNSLLTYFKDFHWSQGSVAPSVVEIRNQGRVVGFVHISENKFQKDKNDIIRSSAFF